MKNKKYLFIFICLLSITVVLTIRGFGFFQLKQVSSDDLISIPSSEVTNQIKWYEYNLDRKRIKYFAVRTEDGSVKTAFDACDVCYNSNKGYRQEGDYVVCNNCGNRYPISGLGTENKTPGGCWPGYIPNNIEGDNILIKIQDLKDGSWRTFLYRFYIEST